MWLNSSWFHYASIKPVSTLNRLLCSHLFTSDGIKFPLIWFTFTSLPPLNYIQHWSLKIVAFSLITHSFVLVARKNEVFHSDVSMAKVIDCKMFDLARIDSSMLISLSHIKYRVKCDSQADTGNGNCNRYNRIQRCSIRRLCNHIPK